MEIPNIDKYMLEFTNGKLILTLKENDDEEYYLTKEQFNKILLANSQIFNCVVKNGEEVISTKVKYKSILIDIYKSMSIQQILQTATFNFKSTNENSTLGYHWCPELQMSIQNKDAQNTMKEILHMIEQYNYSIEISIKLKTDKIIYYNFNI
jgi:hypothetical protein